MSPVKQIAHLFIHNSRRTDAMRKQDRANAFHDLICSMVLALHWERDDWASLARTWGGMCRPLFGDHVVLGRHDDEGWFNRMVSAGNASAAMSFEHHHGRPRFYRLRFRPHGAPKPLDRLCVQDRVLIEGMWWRCTALTPKVARFVLVEGDPRKRRKRLTPKEVRALTQNPEHTP